MHRPNDERNPAIPPNPASTPHLPVSKRGFQFQLAALTLVFVTALGVTGLAYWLKSPNKPESESKGLPAGLFQGWAKPDLVVVLSAQQQGYVLPCGCSEPQVGGLERRYNFIQRLKAKGWPVVAVDLGDVPQQRAPANLPNVQGLIKYRYSMMALKEMGYLAVGIGENEACGNSGFSLASVEGEWAASFDKPAVLAGNLKDADSKYPFLKPMETHTVPGANIKLGMTSIVGPTVAANTKDPSVQFAPSAASIQALLRKMHAEKVDLPILLYHGLSTGAKPEAIECAKYFPDFPIILARCEEDEPPLHPISVDHPDKGNLKNYVFRLGHKGKYLGVLGVYRNGASFNFKYQLVKMSTDYVTPPQEENTQPIRKMMEEYTRELKSKNILKEYTAHPTLHTSQFMDKIPGLQNPGNGVPSYIGSQACGKCHEHAYEVWKKSKHSHAYQTLVNAKHPSLRQYDGECIVCHTVGFGYKTGFTSHDETPQLENVGCESCHGPGSLHARNPNNQEWRDRMNLSWLDARKKGNVKAKNRAIERFCVTCHDIDNDVTWSHGSDEKNDPFIEKWEKRKIIHNNPPE